MGRTTPELEWLEEMPIDKRIRRIESKLDRLEQILEAIYWAMEGNMASYWAMEGNMASQLRDRDE